MTDVFKAADPTTTDGRDPRASALLTQAVTDIEARTDLDPAQRAGLLLAMGRSYLSLKNAPRALDLFMDARQLASEGDDDSARMEARMEVAAALTNVGRVEDALREMEDVGRTLGEQAHVERRLERRFDYIMAVVMQRLGRTDDALPYIERAYRTALAIDGAGTAEVGRAMEVYSVLLVDLDRADQAVAITRLNHEAARRNPRLPLALQASFASASAFALLGAKRFAEAEAAYRDSLEVKERIFGVGHLGTAIAINNVGTALYHQGRHAEAARIYERALAIRREQAPADTMKIARELSTIGKTWLLAGDTGKAITALREGLALYADAPPGDGSRPPELVLRVNLARALEEAGEFPEAITTLQPVLAHGRRQDSAYAGDAGIEVRLLHARLLARAGTTGPGCDAANDALVDAPMGPAAVEARILLADCEWRNGRAAAATSALVVLDGSDSDTGQVSGYARARLAELRRVVR